MRMSRIFVVAVAAFFILFSCKKDRSFESGGDVIPPNTQWEFSASGSSFKGPMDSAFIRTIGVATSLSLSGTTTDGTGTISLQIISTAAITVGDYNTPQVLFQYTANGTSAYQTSADASDAFKITITAIDSGLVSGTFSGIVVDSLGAKQSVTDGKFTAKLGVDNSIPEGTGRLTVWSQQLCEQNGNIEIRVGDSTGQITQAISTQPDCGAAGTASFSLPSGTYNVTAYCGGDSVVYNIGVLPDACTTLEIDLSSLANKDYFPLESRWTYGNEADFNDDTIAISGSRDTTLNGTNYRIFENEETGDMKYYRKNKDSGLYFQYIDMAFGQPLDTPVEIKILQDNVDEGYSWDSPAYSVTLNAGGPISQLNVMLRSSIARKNYSGPIGGRMYNNLIDVSTQMYRVDFDGNIISPIDDSYTTTYGKGVGIAAYKDFENSIDWKIRYFNVSF